MRTFVPRLFSLATLALLLAAALGPAAHAQKKTPKPQPGVALSPSEQELLDEINWARTRPAEYAAFLEQLKPHFKGTDMLRPGKMTVMTKEGWKAVEEAVAALRTTKPLPALEVSGGMCSGAGLLARDQLQTGQTGHKGSDGSFCEERVTRFGMWASPIGENLSYGRHTARERVINFLVDDGVASRNHRKRLLDPSFKVAGIACGDHNSMGSVCVITLAGGFKDAPAGAQTSSPGAKTNQPASVKVKGAVKF